MLTAACAVCLLMAGAAQRLTPSARELLQLNRPLLPAEVSKGLLPLRWSLSVPAATDGPSIPDYGMSFTYDISFDPSPPANVNRPDCIR